VTGLAPVTGCGGFLQKVPRAGAHGEVPKHPSNPSQPVTTRHAERTLASVAIFGNDPPKKRRAHGGGSK
jgi:hypothetical protein